MHEYPRFDSLRSAIEGVRDDIRCSWTGAVYRCVAPKWARSEHLVSGKGAVKIGSRWMRAGLTPAVDAASTESIASRNRGRSFAISESRSPATSRE